AGTGGNDVRDPANIKTLLSLCEQHGLLAIVNDARTASIGDPTYTAQQWQQTLQAMLQDYGPYLSFAGLHCYDEPNPPRSGRPGRGVAVRPHGGPAAGRRPGGAPPGDGRQPVRLLRRQRRRLVRHGAALPRRREAAGLLVRPLSLADERWLPQHARPGGALG